MNGPLTISFLCPMLSRHLKERFYGKMSFVLRLITEVLIEFLDGIFKSTAAH